MLSVHCIERSIHSTERSVHGTDQSVHGTDILDQSTGKCGVYIMAIWRYTFTGACPIILLKIIPKIRNY
jgi:hypothetical protein